MASRPTTNPLTSWLFVITGRLNTGSISSATDPLAFANGVLHLATSKYITAEIAAVIKLARKLGYHYPPIASFFVINQGRIADVMKGRLFPDVPPASALPPGFPALA